MKVLFPVDGSDRSVETIQTAAKMLDKAEIEAHFVYIIVPVVYEVTVSLVDMSQELAEAHLENAKRVAQEAGFRLGSACHVYDMCPAAAICAHARQNGMDMIIMGSHGYQGLEKFLMGSVSEQVFKQAEQPVIVIRNDKVHTLAISHFEKVNLRQV
jgi:nucleotide-binding universal stress UspA family protein